MSQVNSQLNTPVSVANGGTGTNTLLDGGVLLGSGTSAITALDVTAKGSLLVGDGTTDPVALAVSSNDFVLTADSTEASGLKWATNSSLGAWTFISSATASTSATIDFTSDIDSTYDVYMFSLINVVPTIDARALFMRTSSDSGTSWDEGASDYKWMAEARSTNSNSSGDDHIQMTKDSGAVMGTQTGEEFSANIFLYMPSNSSYNKSLSMTGNWYSSQALPTNALASGTRISTSAVNGIRFYPETGSFSVGEFRLYGLSKS